MGIAELIILAFGLAMDAFAVSICKGLAMKKTGIKECAIVGLWFGGFQAAMPLIGYFLGKAFEKYITSLDHWIAFILLGLIGAMMIKESFEKDEDEADASLSVKTMVVMAIATSIDALAVGISLAMAGNVNIWIAIALIGVTTGLFSAVGVKIGTVFGSRFEK